MVWSGRKWNAFTTNKSLYELVKTNAVYGTLGKEFFGGYFRHGLIPKGGLEEWMYHNSPHLIYAYATGLLHRSIEEMFRKHYISDCELNEGTVHIIKEIKELEE